MKTPHIKIAEEFLTLAQLRELVKAKGLSTEVENFPIVMTDDLVGVRDISFKKSNGLMLLVLHP